MIGLSELANSFSIKQTPWEMIAANVSAFIRSTFLPAKFTFVAPKTISKAQVVSFLQFIIDRQEIMPLSDVFRFAKVQNKKRDIVSSCYPGDHGYNEGQAIANERRMRTRDVAGVRRMDKSKQLPVLDQLMVPLSFEKILLC